MEFKVYNEDCFEGMKRIDSCSIDVVVTSPPYNIGANYNSYKDNLPKRDYIEWLKEWAVRTKRVIKENGSVFLNIGSRPSDPSLPLEIVYELNQILPLQNVIHWVKSIAIEKEDLSVSSGINNNITIGHFKPINSNKYLNDCHEYIFHFTKSGNNSVDRKAVGVEYQVKSNLTRWTNKSVDSRCRGNVWFIPYKTIRSRNINRPHPATFPVKLPVMCIKLHGLNKTEIVMDPFMGLGHTGLACKMLDVDFLGFEIDKHYYEYTKTQLKSTIGEVDKSDENGK